MPIIARHGGHANKFVGDGVLAVFGAPERVPDHADRALEAACEIAAAVEEEFGSELAIGIGINSGPVIAGSIGGGGRLEFTVIGDPVNVASRVERATRKTGNVRTVLAIGAGWVNANNGLNVTQFYSGAGRTAAGGRIILASLSYDKFPETTPHIQALDAFTGVELWAKVGKKELPIERPSARRRRYGVWSACGPR